MTTARGGSLLRILIAGGGASGTLLAASLVRELVDVHVTIFDPRERLGAGVAYSTTCPDHVLNVPAKGMSAYACDAGHFVRWLADHKGIDDPNAFVPRMHYGEYLHDIAAQAQREAQQRWQHVRATATAVHMTASGVRVSCDDGFSLDGDVLVVATGNAAPSIWPNCSAAARESSRFFGSAWSLDALVPSDPSEPVVLLGSGLTAVDAVLSLRYHGHCGPISMVSRRGLLPHEHRHFDTPPAQCPNARTIHELVAGIRSLAERSHQEYDNWRVAVDGVRAQTNALWQALELSDQRRFVSRVLPYWNVHRHRMAPAVATTISELIAAGTLRTIAGTTGEIAVNGASLSVPVRLRKPDETIVLEAGRVINCSGPEHDVHKLPNPLIRNLISSGSIVSHPLRIGARVAQDGAFLCGTGVASTRLYALGPVRFGTLIETTAIPEIRLQIREMVAAFVVRYSDRSTARPFGSIRSHHVV